jgi:hypothetical protein
MSQTTFASQRAAIANGLYDLCEHLQQYAKFPLGRVTFHADAGHFTIEVVDRLGWIDTANAATEHGELPPAWIDFTYEARGETLDDAFIALAHKLAGTEPAPADWGKR